MNAKVLSCGLAGISGRLIAVEVDLAGGIPSHETVGLPGKAVSESRERVCAAIKNSGFSFLPSKVVVNLAPADLKKEGTVYDLPVALGMLCAAGFLKSDALSGRMFVGELSLSGEIRPVRGALAMALCAKEEGIREIVLPRSNAAEAACVSGVRVIPANSLAELCECLRGEREFEPYTAGEWRPLFDATDANMALIRGQYTAKRAAEVAAAGGHNMLLAGPPGGGKTMLARALPTILPDLTFEEALEITRIHSAAGKLQEGVVKRRPFVAPHHSASAVSVVGGGAGALPGEISMAHLGVLFLDELPEFPRTVLESLRQPMEDGVITVSRANANATYPARFMLVGAMNLCPCGNSGAKGRECTCTPAAIARYRRRLSGPLLDRMDIFVRMAEVSYDDLFDASAAAESSAAIRKRVNECRKLQMERFKDTGRYANAHMTQKEIVRYCRLDREADKLYRSEFVRRGMSGRGNARTLRLARTIADLDQSRLIRAEHLAEALQYLAADGFVREWT
ncbi:MAG: YifB family Mg chelatase-like AAA ATPase [Christensenellales bacterium]|jgi:magnesium chelatase family protein